MRHLAVRVKRAFNYRGFVVGVILLGGCEAPLNLTGVQQELENPIHRYDQLQAIARNDQQLVVVGEAGVVLSSADNGENWQRLELPSRPSLIDVNRCASGHYVALDTARHIWISDAGAKDWQSRLIDTTEPVMALTCDEQNRIWVVGGFTTIWSSEDDGATWNEFSLGEDMQLTSVQFVDADTGFVTGEFGLVLKTTDGGANWEQTADLPGEFYSQAAYFIDAERGWAVGLNGSILHTSDGGDSWQSQSSGVNLPLYGITGAGETLFAVGENGFILRYSAGSWQVLPHGNNVLSYLRGASADGDSLLVAGGNGLLFKVAAGG